MYYLLVFSSMLAAFSARAQTHHPVPGTPPPCQSAPADTRKAITLEMPAMNAVIMFRQPPMLGKKASFMIGFFDKQTQQPITLDRELVVQFTMPTMTHHNPPNPAVAPSEYEGKPVYLVGPMEPFMPGLWQINLSFKPERVPSDTACFTFNI